MWFLLLLWVLDDDEDNRAVGQWIEKLNTPEMGTAVVIGLGMTAVLSLVMWIVTGDPFLVVPR